MPILPDNPTKTYLGDGVYVSVHWGDLKLETDRDGVTHWIVLEPSVYRALQDYVAAKVARARRDADE